LGFVKREQGEPFRWEDEVSEVESVPEETNATDDEPTPKPKTMIETTMVGRCSAGGLIEGEPVGGCQGEDSLIGVAIPKGFKCQQVLVEPPDSLAIDQSKWFIMKKLKCGAVHKVPRDKSIWHSEVGHKRLASSKWLAHDVDLPPTKTIGPRVDYGEYKRRFGVDPRGTGEATDVTGGCECAGCLTYAAAPIEYRKYNSTDIPVWHVEACTLWDLKVPEDDKDGAVQWGPHGYYRVSRYHKGNIIAGIATMANMIGRVLTPMDEDKLEFQPCPPLWSGQGKVATITLNAKKWQNNIGNMGAVKHGATPNILHLAICEYHTLGENSQKLGTMHPKGHDKQVVSANARIVIDERLIDKPWEEETVLLLNYLMLNAPRGKIEVDGSTVGGYEHYEVHSDAEFIHYKIVADCQLSLETKLKAPGIKVSQRLRDNLSRNTRGTAEEILL
jgi:hypothetical protein